jgi:hypothetical protein
VSIESAACSVGGTVNVPINITGASNIGAMDISVTYDASVLTATGVANGMMITSLPNVIVAHDISAGRVNISFATYPETVNGDGELFVVTFDADAAGNSTLDITVEEAWTLRCGHDGTDGSYQQMEERRSRNDGTDDEYWQMEIRNRRLLLDVNGDGLVTSLDNT